MFFQIVLLPFISLLWTGIYTHLQAVPETGSFLGLSFRTSRTQNEIPLHGTFVWLKESLLILYAFAFFALILLCLEEGFTNKYSQVFLFQSFFFT